MKFKETPYQIGLQVSLMKRLPPLKEVRTVENVYNGCRKIEAENKMFMSKVE
jgi:hypothetical protein